MTNEQKQKLDEWFNTLHGDKGLRSQLKKCRVPAEACAFPHTFRLKHILPWLNTETMATITAIAPYIKNNTRKRLGEALAVKTSSGVNIFSNARYTNLLSATDMSDLLYKLRNAFSIIKGEVNFIDLVDKLTLWNQQFRGNVMDVERIEYKLAEEYFN